MASRVSVQEHDYLDQDPLIRGQKYVCLSFLSPESVLQRKDIFCLHQFLNHFKLEMDELFTSMKQKFEKEADVIDMLDRIRERHDYIFDAKALGEQYDAFVEQNAGTLETEFANSNEFRTSVRGIKVRGSYDTLPEAQKRAETIKKQDPYFDTYIAEVGCWCPWNPSPHEIDEAVHGETELNTLMKKYKENIDTGKVLYEQRRNELTDRSRQHAQRQTAASTSEEPLQKEDPWLANKQASA